MNIELDPSTRIPEGLLPLPLPEERVLYMAEQPIVYLTRNSQGQVMLAYLAGEDARHRFTLLAPISDRDLRLLEQGQLSMRDALTGTWMWLLRECQRTGAAGLWAVCLAQLPENHLPHPGTPLLPEHDFIAPASPARASVDPSTPRVIGVGPWSPGAIRR
ncbi:hypothetical protein [Roseateles chitosanitabidus]|jgi:hypothetical protein|uniref:hypothetical protein n=1 Tax=Roseateles chitosanitabidus TaxID=65048 RepID=UPI000830545F|nr:hypothetical protein [Roseateles chitosanitabidus]